MNAYNPIDIAQTDFEALQAAIDAEVDALYADPDSPHHTNFLPREDWQKLCTTGMLAPFVSTKYGGRASTERTPKNQDGQRTPGVVSENQHEIQAVLTTCSKRSLPLSLDVGIEGSLVCQPLEAFGTEAQKSQLLPKLLNGELKGCLGVTEENVSGSSALEMESQFSYISRADAEADTKITIWEPEPGSNFDFADDREHPEEFIVIELDKWFQGNSEQDFMLGVAKQDGSSRKLNLLLLPQEIIESKEIETALPLPYARNSINKVAIPSSCIVGRLMPKAFQNLFLRSRLQFIGMLLGDAEHSIQASIDRCNERKTTVGKDLVPLLEIPEIQHKLGQMQAKKTVMALMWDWVIKNVDPFASVEDQLVLANTIKALASDYLKEITDHMQFLHGAAGYEAHTYAARASIENHPFRVFEGNNDMLYVQVVDKSVANATRGPDAPSSFPEYLETDPSVIGVKRILTRLCSNLDLTVDPSSLDGSQKTYYGKIFARAFSVKLVQDKLKNKDSLSKNEQAQLKMALIQLTTEIKELDAAIRTSSKVRFITETAED